MEDVTKALQSFINEWWLDGEKVKKSIENKEKKVIVNGEDIDKMFKDLFK